MLHLAHILYLATPASEAHAQAFHLARRHDATLHVVPHPLRPGTQADREELRGRLAERASEALPPGALHIPDTFPESMEAVREYVSDANIDLVVTDPAPKQGCVPPLATETMRALIEQLDRPVLDIGGQKTPAAIHDLFVPTDLSTHALRAFKHAVHLARLYDAAVHVLHVVESIPYVALTRTDRLSLGPDTLSEHRGRRRVRNFLRGGEAADVPVHVHLAYGDAADQVHRFVAENSVDLMVLSSHGRDHRSQAPLGRVARCILEQTPCPLFLVRAFGRSLLARPAESESGTPAA